MIAKRHHLPALTGLATLASCAVATWIVVDTLRSVRWRSSPLPWFDGWATMNLLRLWTTGEMSFASVLFSQHNEHRILVPRLVFFADDLWFHGQGKLGLGAIVLVQALHAVMFLGVLGKARPIVRGRWAVGGVVVALMFSLRQAENFTSDFQLSFVAVFAAATASFMLFARGTDGQGHRAALASSFVAVLVTTFIMANGLVTAFVLVALALMARQNRRIVVACIAWALVLSAVYLQGYVPIEHHNHPADALSNPIALLSYVAVYLGSIFGTDQAVAGALGTLGLVTTVAAVARVARSSRPRPAGLALSGVLLFIVATAIITASGRLNFGIGQALASRYATGSATFWAAQICFWWTHPPAEARRPWAKRGLGAATAVLGSVVMVVMAHVQSIEKPQLAVESFDQNDAANLLLLGLDDPAAILRTAWSDDDVQQLLPMMRERGLSIFGGPDADLYRTPLKRHGALLDPSSCKGGIGLAVADPTLGQDAARVSGQAWNSAEGRQIRRVLVVDGNGIVVGLASNGIPGAALRDWRGYAVATVGETLMAYGVLGPGRFCPLAPAILGGVPPGVQKPGGGAS